MHTMLKNIGLGQESIPMIQIESFLLPNIQIEFISKALWLVLVSMIIRASVFMYLFNIKSHTDKNVLAKTAVKCYSLFVQGYIKKNINDFTSQSLQINRNCPSTDEGGTNSAK